MCCTDPENSMSKQRTVLSHAVLTLNTVSQVQTRQAQTLRKMHFPDSDVWWHQGIIQTKMLVYDQILGNISPVKMLPHEIQNKLFFHLLLTLHFDYYALRNTKKLNKRIQASLISLFHKQFLLFQWTVCTQSFSPEQQTVHDIKNVKAASVIF